MINKDSVHKEDSELAIKELLAHNKQLRNHIESLKARIRMNNRNIKFYRKCLRTGEYW